MARAWNNWKPGDAVPGKKLTDADVREIRALKGLVTQAELSKRFGVSGAHISNIQTGKRCTGLPARKSRPFRITADWRIVWL